jgi:hypothetical protein
VILAAGSGLAVDLLTGIPIVALALFVGYTVFRHADAKGRPIWWAAVLGIAGTLWFPGPLLWWWLRPKRR